jgi:hypothetical protein
MVPGASDLRVNGHTGSVWEQRSLSAYTAGLVCVALALRFRLLQAKEMDSATSVADDHLAVADERATGLAQREGFA